MLAAKVLFVEVAAYRYLCHHILSAGRPHAVLIIIFSMTRIEEASDQRPGADIEIEDLSTGYSSGSGQPRVVSAPFSVVLRRGELTCLLGPNGAGKSTLMRTLTAFQPPLAGRVMIDGRDLSSFDSSELSKLIGVVLTDRLQLGATKVGDLVALGRAPYTGFWGRLSAADHRMASDAMARVGISDLSERLVADLSDGEMQKVMIAKVLSQQTPVIFLDEPTAFLDYPSKVEIMQLLRSLARDEGKTVFMSTHDLELAFQVADTLWLIDKRLGVTTGTPEDLAMAGAPERYFCRDGVRFDATSGEFRIDMECRNKVAIDGSGRWRPLVERALWRNGYFPAVSGEEVSATVKVEDSDGIIVDGEHCGSVAAMLSRLSAIDGRNG